MAEKETGKPAGRTKLVSEGPVDSEKEAIRESVKAVRAKRAKLRSSAVRRDVLSFPKREGFQRRVVNDKRDRIEQFQDVGWTIVEGDETGGKLTARDRQKPGNAITRIVGSGDQGPITGVLMEIPQEVFDEDKAAKQTAVNDKEDVMLRKLKKQQVGSQKTTFG